MRRVCDVPAGTLPSTIEAWEGSPAVNHRPGVTSVNSTLS